MFSVLFLETSLTDENAPNEMAGSDVRPKGARTPVGRSNPSFPNSRNKHNKGKPLVKTYYIQTQIQKRKHNRIRIKVNLRLCRGFVYFQNLKSLFEIDSGKVTDIAFF